MRFPSTNVSKPGKPSNGLFKSNKNLLIVLLAIFSIAIILIVVKSLTKTTPEDTSLRNFTSDLQIAQVKVYNYTDFGVQLNTDSESDSVTSVKVRVYDEQYYLMISQTVSMEELKDNDYIISLHVENTSKIGPISITPTFAYPSGETYEGDIQDTYLVSEMEKYY